MLLFQFLTFKWQILDSGIVKNQKPSGVISKRNGLETAIVIKIMMKNRISIGYISEKVMVHLIPLFVYSSKIDNLKEK